MKRILFVLAVVAMLLAVAPVSADETAAPVSASASALVDTTAPETAAPESLIATADSPGTGALTATSSAAPGDVPGPDLTVGEGIEIVKLVVSAFKGGEWAIGISLIVLLLLGLLRRVYMPILKERLSKGARRVVIGVAGWALATVTGILAGVGWWQALLSGFLIAGGASMIWGWISEIGFVQRIFGKNNEREVAADNGGT